MAKSLTLGSMIAAVVQFVVIVVFMQPMISGIASMQNANYSHAANSIIATGAYVNTTVEGNVILPLQQKASNQSVGFGAISPTSLQIFGGLAFMYGAFGAFYNTFTNFPGLLYQVIMSSASQVIYLPIAIIGILSIAILGYVGVLTVLKFIGFIVKGEPEES